MTRFTLLGVSRVARTSFLTLERRCYLDDEGGWMVRDVVRHRGVVVAIPWDGQRFHLIRQFRAAVGRPVLELPAGKLDVAGEPADEAVRRELVEEMGLEAGRITRLHGAYASPGFTDEYAHFYLAEELTVVPPAPEGLEERTAQRVSMTRGEVAAALHDGGFDDAKTLVGLYAALARLPS
jgi:ADP-ribose pyrophosphatase